MERTTNTPSMNRNLLIAGLIFLFHAVGLTGFLLPQWQALFIELVPFHLLLMFVLLLLSHGQSNAKFVWFLLVIYVAGYGIEYFGVHTGLIFGSYQYGETLGLKLAEIPLLIGVNWVILIYSAGMAVHYLPVSNKWLKTAIAAAILVALDSLIEPVAMRFDYWDWANSMVPVRNYIGWYLFSFVGCGFLFQFLPKKSNFIGPVILLAQFLFFIALNLWA